MYSPDRSQYLSASICAARLTSWSVAWLKSFAKFDFSYGSAFATLAANTPATRVSVSSSRFMVVNPVLSRFSFDTFPAQLIDTAIAFHPQNKPHSAPCAYGE